MANTLSKLKRQICAVLQEPAAVTTVRVLPGYALQVRHDSAPSVTTIYTEGETITDLRYEQAVTLLADGVVEAVNG